MGEERSEFLPPRPAGPEPELGPPPTPVAPPVSEYLPPQQAQPAAAAYAPQAPRAAQAAQAAQPDNGQAVAGFVLSLVAGGLLLISGGLSSIVSIACSIFGIVYSRKGRRRVSAGETTKNAGLAQAGFIIGIVSLVLSVLATIFWILIAVLVATDDEFRRDFEDQLDDRNTITAVARIALACGRALVA
ncbi:MAG: hypothetical protein QOH58_933 [Thermoleophilaceae bacterium]|jgi:hypothetical protein|nr:hypothetical protein [Thermoleophilaceae bacterium]